MKQMHTQLDFELVKQRVATFCASSLAKKTILEEEASFHMLSVERNLLRGKEALKLYEAYESPSFYGLRDISKTLNDISKGAVVSSKEIYEVAQFNRGIEDMHTYMSKVEFEVSHIQDLVASLHRYPKLITAIENCISSSYEVLDSASTTLKGLRIQIKKCEGEISRNNQNLVSKYASILQENITVYRNGRCCLLVKASDKNKIKGMVHGESASGQAVYIEPAILVDLNNQLASLKHKEQEEIYAILKSLCEQIKEHIKAILSDFDTMTCLDVWFAKAHWAFVNGGVYADLNTDKYLCLKHARHPLINEKEVVSNTYEIKAPYKHLLISGSNTGGKTVTLKTIGLFTVLTYASFPILCEEASIPYVDGVYVDVGDAQSIVHSLSTFSAHISKLAYICKHASCNSLVLLDELGSGTDPQEGESIAIATLEYLRKKGIMCIATTHYSKLKEYAKNKEDILMASVGFDMEKMKPTYRYLEGFSGVSNALEIAQRYHLQQEIIEHAYILKESNKTDAQKLLEKLDADLLDVQQQKEIIRQKEIQLQHLEQDILHKQQQLEKEKIKQIEKAKQEAIQIKEDAMLQADTIIDELKAMKSNVKTHEIIEVKAKFNDSKVEEETIESKETFALKDYVELIKLGYHGEIIALKGNRATVFANGMKMNVKTNELRKTNRPKTKKVTSHSSKTNTSRVSMECNVIGYRASEALIFVDKYMDSAVLAKLGQVRIVHGMGTGVLKNVVHEYLKKSKYVESYRLGGEGEGGFGATVVTLKKGSK